jgi:hypothetical protein
MEDKFFLEKKKKKVFFGLRAHALLRLAMKIANKDFYFLAVKETFFCI